MPPAIVSRATQLETPSDGQTVDDVENMALINQLANTPLSRGQVYIRSMYLCSSQLCESDWCRFTTRALDSICRKVVGQSVLAGHDKRTLPVARFFKAALVERPEVPEADSGKPTLWVRAWFYWLKGTHGADDLALNMDGGIYREVSISWRYSGGHCSICGKPMRSCPHQAGEVYDNQVCYTWIENILDVLEGSLVYKGADRETAIAGEHQPRFESQPTALERLLLFEVELFRDGGSQL